MVFITACYRLTVEMCCVFCALSFTLLQAYSPVRGLRPEQVLGLGCLVTELGERELQDTNLTDLGVLAYLGALTDWSPKMVTRLSYSNLRCDICSVEGCPLLV